MHESESNKIYFVSRKILNSPKCIFLWYLQAARNTGVPVIFDAGGFDAPIPQELLDFVDIFSPNESELARLTGLPTESFEEITQAAVKCHKLVSLSSILGFILKFVAHCSTLMLYPLPEDILRSSLNFSNIYDPYHIHFKVSQQKEIIMLIFL
jgi:hypothetical protein